MVGGVFGKVLSGKGTKRKLWVMAEILMATKLEPLGESGSLATSDIRPGEGVTDDARRFA